MRRFIFDKARVNEWVWPKIGRERKFEPERGFNVIGVEEDGELIAGVVIDSFCSGARCSIHAAGIGRRWCSRELLKFLFEYVFNVAKVNVVINSVAEDNEESMIFTKKVGFTEVCRIPEGAGDCALVIFTMHKKDCRWIGEENELHFKKAA